MAAAIEQRPYEAYHEPGKTASAVLAVVMHLLLAALLVLGINWQSRPPEAVTVELWTAPPPPPAPAPPRVEPKPEPKVEAPPPPKVEPKPEPKVEQKPDIAIEQEKRRLEQERKDREAEAERQKKLAEQKKAEELKKQEEQKKLAEQKRLEEEKQKKLAEQKKAEDAKRAADDRRRMEQQNRDRMNAELARELGNTAPAAGIPGARITGPANVAGATSGDTDAYKSKIAAKIKGNVIVPMDVVGNPTAEFDVTQDPTGQVLTVRLAKSSGNRALDEAWERAILKSSPLPKPDNPAAFERKLSLRFRPND